MSKRCARRTLSRLPALMLITVVVASIAPTARAQIDPAEVVDQIDEATLRHYLDDLLYTHDGDNRYITGPDHDPARDNIVETFRGFGLDPRLESFRYSGGTYYNVVAIQEGLLTPDQQYIISGHYDSVGNPGADDDGTGCAAVMEIARVLTQYTFESTIIYIAFDAEEQVMIGSSAYVADHPDDDVRGMISMDMIGHGRGTGRCDIYGRAASNPIKTALRDALVTYNEGMTPRVFGALDRSDHAPFERAGKQACLLIEAFGPDANPCYHQACDSVDTPDYIHYDYLTQLTRGVTGYLVEHAGLMTLPLEFSYPTGLPERVLPSGATRMRVVVSAGSQEPMKGTANLHYLVDDTFQEVPLQLVGPNAYDVVFPAVECGETLAFYVSAQTTGGDVVTDPFAAPNRLHAAVAIIGRSLLFADDFETDTGWTVTNEDLTDGAWERAVPIQGQNGPPQADFDGSGRCYLTGNERLEDIDGGPTHLTSPPFDLAGEEARVRYARWFLGGSSDFLDVAVSGDDGRTWQLVEHVDGDQYPWREHEFLLSEFVNPSSAVRIRFSAADNPNNSFAEAALDALSINGLLCGTGEIVRPDEAIVTRGQWRSGDIEELLRSDNEHVVVDARRPTEVGAASVEIELVATAPTSDPTELVLVVESACRADPVVQRIELFNYATMRWELFDERPAPSVDATTAIGIRGRAGDFVDPDTREIRARIGYGDRGVTFPAWHGAYDEIYWLIAP